MNLNSIYDCIMPGKEIRYFLGLPESLLFPKTLTISINPANIRS